MTPGARSCFIDIAVRRSGGHGSGLPAVFFYRMCNANGALRQVGTDTNAGIERLTALGAELDAGRYPSVFTGGVVEPGATPSAVGPGIEEDFGYGGGRAGGSAAGSRQGSAGRARAAGGSAAARQGEASASTSVVGEFEAECLTGELSGVEVAYPRVRIHATPDTVILLNWIQPIRGLPDSALLLTAWPRAYERWPASWAWWSPGIWVGERHTNYPDGSVCAFEVSDGTWRRGQSAVGFLDLQSIWLARHLYLKRLGRWPGRQILHTAHERVSEHRPGELCGCDSEGIYERCCRERDLRLGAYGRLKEFRSWNPHRGSRRPPEGVVRWLLGTSAEVPRAEEITLRWLSPPGVREVGR